MSSSEQDDSTSEFDNSEWTERLIEAIQSRPAIYDKRLKEHSDRNLVSELWKEVGQCMVNRWTKLTPNTQQRKESESDQPPAKKASYDTLSSHQVKNNKKERQKRYREQNRDKLKQREAERRERIRYSQSIAGPSTSSNTNRIELNNEEIITAQSSSGSEKIQPSSIQRNDLGNELNVLQKKRERQQRYREQNRDKLKQREVERRRRLKNAGVITELSTSPNIEFTKIINDPIIDEISINSRNVAGLEEMQHVVVEVSQQIGRSQSSANTTEIPNNYSQFRYHKSAHEYFYDNFKNNEFGHACSICDRLFSDKNTGMVARRKAAAFLAEHNIDRRAVPIVRRTSSIPLDNNKTIVGKRNHFPLISGCAMTIHKSQGGTFDEVVYEYSKSHSIPLLYVALTFNTSNKS